MRWGILWSPRLVTAALLLLAGCAQPTGSAPSSTDTDSLPASVSADHWETGVKKDGERIQYANAGIANAARDAALLLGCTVDDKSVMLLVDPNADLAIDPGMRPVTIILDGDTTFIQNWKSLPGGYAIEDSDLGFTTAIEALKKHKVVEFVLGRPGKDIDKRSFKLNGAPEAIDNVIANCAKKA